MKKFVLRLTVFALVVILIATGLDMLFSKQLMKLRGFAFGEGGVWNDIIKGNVNADVVVYGSSRAWVHIDPQILEDSLKTSSYNLGMDGHNFWMQYLRHQKYMEHNRKPQTILVCVDVLSLELREDLYNAEQFLPYMLWDSEIKKTTQRYIGYKWYDYYFPFIRYHGKHSVMETVFKSFVAPGSSDIGRTKGFEGMYRKWNEDLTEAKKKMGSYVAHPDSVSITLFKQFLSDCKTDTIQVILVYTPEYVEGQTFIKNRKEIIAMLEDIAAKHEVPLLNYTTDSMCMNKDLFYNSTHMNHIGAEIFSQKLAHDLKQYVKPAIQKSDP